MAFFEVPEDEDLSPEVKRLFEDYRRVRGGDVGQSWRVFGWSPRIFETRLRAYENLSDQCPFSWLARATAVMLIAHAKRCQTCFTGARNELDKLGFDEEQLDTMCAHPEALPLNEGDRLFVRYAQDRPELGRPHAEGLPRDGGKRVLEGSDPGHDRLRRVLDDEHGVQSGSARRPHR
jgi:hypothetical protein